MNMLYTEAIERVTLMRGILADIARCVSVPEPNIKKMAEKCSDLSFQSDLLMMWCYENLKGEGDAGD